MSQRLLHSISIVPLLLGGCFGSHTNGDDPDASTVDATMPVPDASTPDAEPDAPGIDAPPSMCPLARADLLCDFSHVPANTPTTIPVALAGCHCVGHVACVAAIGGDHVLELTTNDCTNPDVDCDGCNPFLDGTCDLPPLEEGTWRVDVNGLPTFELQVTPEDVLPERGSVCVHRGGEDESCGVGWPPNAFEPGSTCHRIQAFPNERVPIRVTNPCGGCGSYAGPCKVDVFDDVIRVQPSSIVSLCDVDCPAICTPREDTCWTPRLEEGTWRVLIDGLDYESTLVVAAEPAPGEVCGPIFPHD